MKKAKSILIYLATYVLITLLTAVGVVLISGPTSASNNRNEVTTPDDGKVTIPPQLNYIMENFASIEAMNLSLSATIKTATDNFVVNIDGLLDLQNGFENIKAQGTLGVNINGSELKINFSYLDGIIYLNMLNGNYKIETSNIMESVTQILNLLNVQMPELGLDLGNLDVSTILSMFSDLTEVKSDTYTTLNINIPMVGALSIICDLNYGIRSITLPQTSLEGITFSIGGKIDYPETVEIEKPTDDYIEVTEIFNILEALLNTLKQDTIGLNLNVSYNGLRLSGKLSANLKDLSMKFETNILGRNLNLFIIDNIIYLEYANINVKFALTDANLITSLLKDNFGIEIPLDEIMGILASIKTNEISETLKNFDLNSVDFGNIDLSIIESFIKTNTGYILTLKNIGSVELDITNHKISKLTFDGFGANATLTTTEADEIKLSDKNYLDVKILIPTIDSLIKTLKNSNIFGTGEINIANNKIAFDYQVSWQSNKFVANINVMVLNKTLNIKIIDDNIYLEFSGIKVTATLNDIELITDFIKENLNINLDTTKIKDIIKDIINPEINPELITSLVETKTGLELTLFNGLKLNIENAENENIINISFENLNINIIINSNNNEVNVPTINNDEYTPLCEFISIAKNLINYIKQNKFYFQFDLSFQNFVVNGVINYNGTLAAEFNTIIEGKAVLIQIVNNIIYVDIDGLKISFNLNDLTEILKFVDENFSINVANEINNLITELSKTDITKILESFEIGYKNNKLTINIANANIELTFNNNILNNITAEFSDVLIKLNILNQISNIEVINPEKYFNIITALPLVNSVLNTVNSGALMGNINFVYENINLNVSLKIQLKPTIQIWAQVNLLGTNLRINYLNNTIYVQYDKLLVKFDLANLPEFIEFLNTNFNFNISKDFINKIDISKIKLGDINNIVATVNKFSANIFGTNLNITFNEFLESIILNSSFKLKLNVTGTGKEVVLPIINDLLYEDGRYLFSIASNLMETLRNKTISINGNIDLNGNLLPVNADIDFSNGIKVHITTVVLGKTVEIYLIKNIIYINFDGLKLKYNVNEIDVLIQAIKDNFNIDLNKILKDNTSNLINKISILNVNKNLNINGYNILAKLLINNNNLNLQIGFNNSNELKNVIVNFGEINANINLVKRNVNIELNTSDFVSDINNLVGLLKPVKNLLDNKQFESNGNIKLKLFGFDQDIVITSLKADFRDINNIKLSLAVNFNGVSAFITYQNNTIFADANGLKVKLNINDIPSFVNWINSTFNQNITLDNIADSNLTEILNGIYFGTITSILPTPSGLIINMGNNNIIIDYSSTFEQVIVNMNDVSFNLKFNKFNNIEFAEINENDYQPYTELTNFVTTIINYVNTKQFNLNANAKVYNGNTMRFDANVNLQIDMIDKFGAYADVKLTGEQNINLQANIFKDYFYFDYNNLALKINSNDMQELLVIALNLIGIDPSILPFLTDIANGMEVDFGNISSIIPSFDMSNPLAMLNIIKNINFDNNNLILTLDGTKITSNPNAKEMKIVLETNGEQLTKLSVNNLFTGVTENEYFNLDLNFSEFNGLTTPDFNKNYIDLSNSNELIKAVINTAELNDYEIEGSLKINGNLIGININWNVPLNIKVKLDENRMPEITAIIGEIPTLIGVNNDVPYKFGDTESGSGRMLYIHYKDGKVYFYRTEYVDIMFGAGKRKYEKKLMVSLDEVMANPLDYVQYGIGFSDAIMGAIRTSLENSKGHVPNLGNIIKSFTVVNSKDYSVVLNMRELTNDSKMDTMTIGLGIVNNGQTNNKNYIGKASFNMYMPLADVFKLTLDSNNLTLKDIGKNLDLSSMHDYINSYSYNEDAKWEANNGSWELASAKTYTIDFVENGGTNVNNIVQSVNTPISLPTYNDMVQTDINAGTRKTFRFDGWFTTTTFDNGTLFTSTLMPRGDITLYAKWTLINTEYVKAINFNSNGGTSISSISALAGQNVNVDIYVPTKNNTYVDKGYNWVGSNMGKWTYHVTRYTFAGWFTDSACNNKFNGVMPDNDITLFAKWNSTTTTEYYYNWERP